MNYRYYSGIPHIKKTANSRELKPPCQPVRPPESPKCEGYLTIRQLNLKRAFLAFMYSKIKDLRSQPGADTPKTWSVPACPSRNSYWV